jgi:hypothetical protein
LLYIAAELLAESEGRRVLVTPKAQILGTVFPRKRIYLEMRTANFNDMIESLGFIVQRVS